jgi:16S rRNA (cytosine967-C5)-methyltransferase
VIAPARRAAYEVVRRVFEDDAYADRALRTAVEGLDERDRALAQRLAYGTVQRKRTLDHAIEAIGKRPTRKLDPPVLAALRLGAYQLGYTDLSAHAVVDDSVELVRRARLERAVPFTNAVMRRLTEKLRGLLGSLPEGPLKHSYPDWIYDVWKRDLGEEDALSLMRAQNEPSETVVRLVRGDPPGEPTDVPGAYRVERVDEQALEEGRIWPQSRASQLAALVVGSQDGERVLDVAAAPGGKATMLRGEVTAVELHPGRARELRGERQEARRGERHRRRGGCDGPAAGLDDFEPRDRRRTVLGLGVLARRPDLRWRARPLPTSSSRSCGRRRSGRSPAGRSSTRSARSTRTRTRPSSTPWASRSSRSRRSGRSTRTRGGRSSCSHDPTSTARRASSSRGYVSSPCRT